LNEQCFAPQNIKCEGHECRFPGIGRALQAFLDEYIKAAGIGDDRRGALFRSTLGRTGDLNGDAMHRIDAYRIIQRRAAEFGMKVKIGCHTFRATGITGLSRSRRDSRKRATHGGARKPVVDVPLSVSIRAKLTLALSERCLQDAAQRFSFEGSCCRLRCSF
jgi:hypothetical protein